MAKSFAERQQAARDIAQKQEGAMVDRFRIVPSQIEFLKKNLSEKEFSVIKEDVKNIISENSFGSVNNYVPYMFRNKTPGLGNATLDPYIDMAVSSRSSRYDDIASRLKDQNGFSSRTRYDDIASHLKSSGIKEILPVDARYNDIASRLKSGNSAHGTRYNDIASRLKSSRDSRYKDMAKRLKGEADVEPTIVDHIAHVGAVAKNPVNTLTKDFDYLGGMRSELSDYADLHWKNIPWLRGFGSYEGNISGNADYIPDTAGASDIQLYTPLRDRVNPEESGIRVNEESSVNDIPDAVQSFGAGLASTLGSSVGGLAYVKHLYDKAGDDAQDWVKQEFSGLNQQLFEKEKTGYKETFLDVLAKTLDSVAKDWRGSVKNPDSALNKTMNFAGGYVPYYALMAATGGTSIPAHIASTLTGAGVQSLAGAGNVFKQMQEQGTDYDTSMNAANKSLLANMALNSVLEGVGGPHGIPRWLASTRPLASKASQLLYRVTHPNRMPLSVLGNFPGQAITALKYGATIPGSGFKSAAQALGNYEINRASMETANDGVTQFLDSLWNKSEPTSEKFQNIALPAFVGGSAIGALNGLRTFKKSWKQAGKRDENPEIDQVRGNAKSDFEKYIEALDPKKHAEFMKMADSFRSAAKYHSKLKVPKKVSKEAWYDEKMSDGVYQLRSDLHKGLSKAEMQSQIGNNMRNNPDMMSYVESIAHALNSVSPGRRAELLKKYPGSASEYYKNRGFGQYDKDLLDVLSKTEKGKLFTAPVSDNESGGSKKLAFLDEHDKRLQDILQGQNQVQKNASQAAEIVRRVLESNPGTDVDWAERFGKQKAAYRKAYVHEGKGRFGQSRER